jgi:hypothetical protein
VIHHPNPVLKQYYYYDKSTMQYHLSCNFVVSSFSFVKTIVITSYMKCAHSRASYSLVHLEVKNNHIPIGRVLLARWRTRWWHTKTGGGRTEERISTWKREPKEMPQSTTGTWAWVNNHAMEEADLAKPDIWRAKYTCCVSFIICLGQFNIGNIMLRSCPHPSEMA